MSYVSSCGLIRRRKQHGAPPLVRVNMGAAFPVIFAFFPASQTVSLSQPVSMKHALVRWMTPRMALATWLNNVLYAI